MVMALSCWFRSLSSRMTGRVINNSMEIERWQSNIMPRLPRSRLPMRPAAAARMLWYVSPA